MHQIIKLLQEQKKNVIKHYHKVKYNDIAYNNSIIDRLNHLSNLNWFNKTLHTEKLGLMIYSKKYLINMIKHSHYVKLYSSITQATLNKIRKSISNCFTVIIMPHSIADTNQHPVHYSEFRVIDKKDLLTLISSTISDLGGF